MTFRLMIRGFVNNSTILQDGGLANQRLVFKERVTIAESDMEKLLPDLAAKHAAAMVAGELHMIEIEFLDEPDPLARFFRMGTDARGMVKPVAIPLDNL